MTFQEPKIIERPAQPYVAFRRLVRVADFSSFADHLSAVPEWLATKGQTPIGPPFFKYDVIDMQRELQMQGGFPVAAEMKGEDEFFSGTLPAGRYVSVSHVGAPPELMEVTRRMLDWAEGQGLRFDHRQTPDGDAWACRLEIYKTDPREVPDWSQWETELAFKLIG